LPKVSVVRIKKDLYEGVASVIEKLGGIEVTDKRVLIKPNLVEPRSPKSGDITNPDVVEAIIRYCKNKGAKEIIIGEGPSYYQSETRLRECFTKTGISKVAERYGVQWFVFDDYPYRSFSNFSPYTPSEFRVSEFIFSVDVIINVPVMKTHFMSTVTLAMKNLKGCLKREDKPKFHRNLAKAVVELNKIVRPHLNIVDGTNIKNNPPVLVAGYDIVAVDSVASSIMGFKPSEIDMIKFGYEEGLGEMRLEKIEIEGEDLAGLKMNLETPSEEIKKKFPFIQLEVKGACCGCLIPILSSLSEMEKERMTKHLRLIAGKENKIETEGRENIICIGDCTRKIKKGLFVGGCPPEKKKIKDALYKFFKPLL